MPTTKKTIIGVRNGVTDSASPAKGVDLKFGDVVAINTAGGLTIDGPLVVDGYNQNNAIVGVVTGANGIPYGGSGPICIEGACRAKVLGDGSNPLAAGAYLDLGSTQENGSGAGLHFKKTALEPLISPTTTRLRPTPTRRAPGWVRLPFPRERRRASGPSC